MVANMAVEGPGRRESCAFNRSPGEWKICAKHLSLLYLGEIAALIGGFGAQSRASR